MVEQAGEQVREQRRPSYLRVANRFEQRFAVVGRAVLDVRDHLQGALGGPAVVGVGREPLHRGVQVFAVDLEAALLKVRVADVGVVRGEPVQGPALRRHEPHGLARDAVLADLEVDAVRRRLGERHPHFTLQRQSLAEAQQPRRSHQLAVAADHLRARGGRVEAGDGDAHEVLAAVGLGVQGGGAHFDRGRDAVAMPPQGRKRAQEAEKVAPGGHGTGKIPRDGGAGSSRLDVAAAGASFSRDSAPPQPVPLEGARMKRLALAIALVAIVGACKKADQQPASQPAMDTSKTMMADTSKHMMADTAKMAPAPTKTTPTKMAPARTKTKRP